MTTKKLLVIDDNDDHLQILTFDLKTKPGWEISIAHNGREGITKAKSILPDIILCDLMIPDLKGLDVCKALKSNPSTRSIPFIFMTVLSLSEILPLKIDRAEGIIFKPLR